MMASSFEQIVELIHSELDDATIEKAVFRVDEAKRGKPRRILWIPIDFSPVERKRTIMREVDGQVARIVSAEVWNIEAHITGANFEDIEQIRERLLTVMSEIFPGDSAPNGGVWVTQDTDRAGVMLGGREKVVQRFLWSMNIVQRTQVVPIEHIETTPQLVEELETPFVTDAP